MLLKRSSQQEKEQQQQDEYSDFTRHMIHVNYNNDKGECGFCCTTNSQKIEVGLTEFVIYWSTRISKLIRSRGVGRFSKCFNGYDD